MLSHLRLLAFGLTSTLLGLILGQSDPALAQSGTCPPGYYPVNGGGVMGCAPMPGGGQGSGYEPGYWADRYATVVWASAPDGSPTFSWATRNASQAASDAMAMRACQEQGFHDCRVAIRFSNGYFAVARAADGTLYAGSAFEAGGAKKQALTQCKSDNRGKCKIIEVQRSRAEWVG